MDWGNEVVKEEKIWGFESWVSLNHKLLTVDR